MITLYTETNPGRPRATPAWTWRSWTGRRWIRIECQNGRLYWWEAHGPVFLLGSDVSDNRSVRECKCDTCQGGSKEWRFA